MLKLFGILCTIAAIVFDLGSYWKQIRKTLRTKHSAQVSSSSYLSKITHYLCSLTALTIYCNWAGFAMEFAAFIAFLICFYLVILYKPKGWKLFN